MHPQDGRWHMFTLTTHRAGVKGYDIYLDGRLAGSMTGATTRGASALGPSNACARVQLVLASAPAH